VERLVGVLRAMPLVELNPDYFVKARPEAIQLLVVSTLAGRRHGESDARLADREAMEVARAAGAGGAGGMTL
jgi:hypothetical protein